MIQKKEKLIGYTVGKYGVDIFAGGAVSKVYRLIASFVRLIEL